jgi:hypothetical protein
MLLKTKAVKTPQKYSSKSDAQQAQAVIPTGDQKSLYDFAVDCKACQSKLAAVQGDLTDEPEPGEAGLRTLNSVPKPRI